MPVQETIELHDALTTQGGIVLARLFVNRFPQRVFSRADEAVFDEHAGAMPAEVALARRHQRDVARAEHALETACTDRFVGGSGGGATGPERGAPRGGTFVNVAAQLSDYRLVVCVGPGGVGKTTLAASMALQAAHRLGAARLSLPLIQPRRLADALGLDGLTDALQPVDIGDAPGTLHAAMLDTGQSYDNLIARIAEPEAARLIQENRGVQSVLEDPGA